MKQSEMKEKIRRGTLEEHENQYLKGSSAEI